MRIVLNKKILRLWYLIVYDTVHAAVVVYSVDGTEFDDDFPLLTGSENAAHRVKLEDALLTV